MTLITFLLFQLSIAVVTLASVLYFCDYHTRLKESRTRKRAERKVKMRLESSKKQMALEQNNRILAQIIDSGECPDCGDWDMYEGPSGGISTNIYCGNCGSHFNHTPGFITDRIHQVDSSGRKNMVELDKNIIKNWRSMKIPSSFLWSNQQFHQVLDWCEANCRSKWSANSIQFYFKSEEDAMAFKMTWV